MRRIRSAAVGVVIVGVLLTTGAAAQAAPAEPEGSGGKEVTTFASQASCHFEADLALNPGVTDAGTSTDFTTIGEVPFYCTEGAVYGSPVIPDVAGTYREWGSSSGDCAAGQGYGDYEAYIPTQDGVKRVAGSYYLWYSNGSGGEDSRDDSIVARFTFTPKEGSCTTEDPLVKVHLTQTETLTTY